MVLGILNSSGEKHTSFVQIILYHDFHGIYFLRPVLKHYFYVIMNLSSLADLDLNIFILRCIGWCSKDKLMLIVLYI